MKKNKEGQSFKSPEIQTHSGEISTNHSKKNSSIDLLFDFTTNGVPNLFTKSSSFFLLDFSDQHFICRAALECESSVHMTAVYVPFPVLEDCISFLGIVKIRQGEKEIEIKIPGECAYDPAGITGSRDNDEIIQPYQHNFILKLVSLEINAVLSGVGQDNLDLIYESLHPYIVSQIKKEVLVEWIHQQIKIACYFSTTPPRYGEFIISKIINGSLTLYNSRNHTKEYLEALLNAEQSNRRPTCPDEYTLALKNHNPRICVNPRKDASWLARKGVLKLLAQITLNFEEYKGENIDTCLYFSNLLENEYEEETSCNVM